MFHDFKEVGGKENWENPASLVGWTEIYTKDSEVFCHIAGKRRGVRAGPGYHCGCP